MVGTNSRRSGSIVGTLAILAAFLSGAFLPVYAQPDRSPIPKPCDHRPGSRKSWEGLFCSGNLQLVATLGVHGIGLVYNSLDSFHQEGFGYGWRLNVRSTLVQHANSNVTIHRADGTPVHFTWNGSDWAPEPQMKTRLGKDAQGLFVETLVGGTRYLYQPGAGGTFFLHQIVERNGDTVTISRDGQNHETTLVDANGLTTTFEWNGDWLQSVRDHEGRVFTLGFNQDGELESVTQPSVDAGTPVERFLYDAESNHLVTSCVSPAGMISDFVYHRDGSVKTLIDPTGYSTEVSYSETSVTLEFSLGERLLQEYKGGTLVATGNHLGEWSTLDRDNRRRVTKLVDNLGHTWLFEYNERDDMTCETDPAGLDTASTYDTRHNRLTVTRLGQTWRYQYNEFDQITEEANPLNEITAYHRDAKGNLTQIVGPDGTTILQVELNPDGTIRSMADQYGQTSTFEYDAYSNISLLQSPDFGRSVRSSSPMGLLLHEINDLGEITKYFYDALGRLVAYEYPADPDSISGRGRRDARDSGVVSGSTEVDLNGRSTSAETCFGDSCTSESRSFDPQTGATSRDEKNGDVLQDGVCPCRYPPKQDGGTDADGGEDGVDGGADDGSGEDGSSEDGGGEDGSSEDGSSQDGSGEDNGGSDGSGEDGGSDDVRPDGADDEECPDADPPPDECQAMAQVSCGQTVSGSISGGGTMTLFTPCSEDIPFTGGEYIYELILDAESMHVSALLKDLPEGIDFDVFALEGACRPDRCKEKGSMEAYFGVKPCMAPYYIVVKGYEPDDSGPFTLEVTCFN